MTPSSQNEASKSAEAREERRKAHPVINASSHKGRVAVHISLAKPSHVAVPHFQRVEEGEADILMS